MANERTLKVTIVGDASSVTRAMQQVEGGAARLNGALSGTAKIAGGFLAANVIAGGVTQLQGYFSGAKDAASGLAESMNAVNVVFGDSAGVIEAFGKTSAEQVGLSQRAFNELATPLGASLKNAGLEDFAGQTVELTKRAADMASVFNTDVEDALGAIQAGLRGEADPLERFGVGLSAAKVEAKALADTGKTVASSLTEEEKALARINLIMEQTSAVRGDFANTSDGLANKERVLAARQEEVSAQIGTKLMPVYLALSEAKLKVATVIAEHVVPALGRVASWLNEHVVPAVQAAAGFVTGTLLPAFESLVARATPLVQRLAVFVGEQLARFQGYFQEHVRPAMDNIVAAVEGVIGFIQAHWPLIAAIVVPILEQVKLSVQTSFAIITGVLDVLIRLLGGDFRGAWEAARGIVDTVLDHLVGTMRNAGNLMKGIVGDFLQIGRNLIGGLMEGIKARAGDLVNTIKTWVTDKIPQFVKDALGIRSPSTVFAGIGEEMMSGLALGIRQGTPLPIEALQELLQRVRETAAGGLTGLIGGNAGFGAGIQNAGGFTHTNLDGSVVWVSTDPSRPARGGAPSVSLADFNSQGGVFGPQVVQNISVTVEDRSPAAIRNAAVMAGEELASQLDLTGVR